MKQHPQDMETIQVYRHTQARERLRDSEELHTNLPLMPYVQIPHTQHRPICVSVNPVIVAQPTTSRRRFNLKKAEWEGFSADLDSNNEEVDAIPENYERFVEMLHDSPWTTWRCLNRLLTCYTCSKEQRKKWQYFDGDTTCVCSLATENTAHMIQCTLLARPCTLDDLSKFNDTVKSCKERWKTTVR